MACFCAATFDGAASSSSCTLKMSQREVEDKVLGLALLFFFFFLSFFPPLVRLREAGFAQVCAGLLRPKRTRQPGHDPVVAPLCCRAGQALAIVVLVVHVVKALQAEAHAAKLASTGTQPLGIAKHLGALAVMYSVVQLRIPGSPTHTHMAKKKEKKNESMDG